MNESSALPGTKVRVALPTRNPQVKVGDLGTIATAADQIGTVLVLFLGKRDKKIPLHVSVLERA